MSDSAPGAWARTKSFVGSVTRHLPLISGLPDCKYRHVRDAFKEVGVNFILSTSPLWLGSLIVFGVDTDHEKTFTRYFVVLIKDLSSGEMLIFATAAIAPIFYFALTPPRQTRDFPGRLSNIVCGLLVFMICTALFGAQRSGAKIDPNFILPGSVMMYVFSLFMIFVATVYKNWRDQAEEIKEMGEAEIVNKIDETNFVEKAKDHRHE